MATKMKPVGWGQRDRNSQIANAMYPHLADPTVQKQMLDRAASDPAGDRAGLARRIADGQRTYGAMAKPSPPRNYDNVPGLRRK